MNSEVKNILDYGVVVTGRDNTAHVICFVHPLVQIYVSKLSSLH